MEQTVLKIALAALMHDIGKFAQETMEIPPQYATDNAAQYQPFYNNRHTHVHVLYTAAFIEQFAEKLPACLNEFGWGEGDSFINLAAGHHKPETAMQECISQADCLSAGLDRANFSDQTNIPFTQFRSTRLLSVLEALALDGDPRQQMFGQSDSYTSAYPLESLSATSIFPAPKKNIPKGEAVKEYQKLFNEFTEELEVLPHRTRPEIWVQHFDSLLSRFISHIPAARVGGVVPDVSLYDHCRTTAALAVPLYVYHKATDTLEPKAIRDLRPEKFLLVSGDFYGIQDFIFSSGGEQQRLRAKLLRGRSFAVSMFSELAAESLCRALNLPFTAVFLNAAGKFHLLAANTDNAQEVIVETTGKLNEWLFKISYGQASLGVTTTPTAATGFCQGGFSVLWDQHLQAMVRKKYQRMPLESYGVVDTFLSGFNTDLEKPLCPFCGKRPSGEKAEKDPWIDRKGSACTVCRDHIMLGANLVKGKTLAVFDGNVQAQESELLQEPFFGRYQVRFMEGRAVPEDKSLIKFCQLNVQHDGSLPGAGTTRLLNGYVPVYTEQVLKNKAVLDALEKEENTEDPARLVADRVPLTFNAIAALAKRDGQGTAALGVLKADVDHLGMFMSCGMTRGRFTISRMATLSRRLDQFFTLYLPHLLRSTEEYNTVYTVFAGGDDLFLIGPWNTMASLARRLRKEWGRYVSGNDQDSGLTFSAGITLHKTHEPVDKLADTAEEALKQAKGNGRNRISMFGESVTWDKFATLREQQQAMADWVDRGLISKVMLYRFNAFIDMAGKARRVTGGGQPVHMRDMECLKWPALLRYSLERNIRKKGVDRDAAMREVVIVKNWLEEYGSALKIALWSQLYEQR
ncbi:type III-A CRISPR-associated protein Cas10/Csm1 [Desulfolithobacter sp.]